MKQMYAWMFGISMTATEFCGLGALHDWSDLRSWGVFFGCVALSSLFLIGTIRAAQARGEEA